MAKDTKQRYVVLYRLHGKSQWLVHPEPFKTPDAADSYARMINTWRGYVVAYADLADEKLRGRDFG